jgi:Arc/MetJ-type ribon-helix-helix transcriptional regulator
MGKRASVSFRDDEEELWEWMEEMHEDGPYRSRTAVMIKALEVLKEEHEAGEVFT